jgi:transcriptional regulator with XRE-family HTH domain
MGITQGEAAQRIGVDQGTLARWERGEREPKGEFLVQAKRFLAAAESECPALTA